MKSQDCNDSPVTLRIKLNPAIHESLTLIAETGKEFSRRGRVEKCGKGQKINILC